MYVIFMWNIYWKMREVFYGGEEMIFLYDRDTNYKWGIQS